MAGGRDLSRRSPRWLNWLICSCGVTAVVCFFWRVVASESDGNEALLGTTALVSRLLAAAVLPALLLLTAFSRATGRLVERLQQRPSSDVWRTRISVRALRASYRAFSSRLTSQTPDFAEASSGKRAPDGRRASLPRRRVPSPPRVAAGS